MNTWRPSASILNLFQRASIIAKVRRFFADRTILEVETPILSQFTVTDVHIFPFQTYFLRPGEPENKALKLWLTTSPEYHMKRLLAAGSGPIYQLCHSFRNQEIGRYHNPEFTILEWYQPSYDMRRLMDEVNEFLQYILQCGSAEFLSYQAAFLRYLNLDPLLADMHQIRKTANTLGVGNVSQNEEDRDRLLELLFISGIENNIGKEKPIFIYHFPATQAALAAINKYDHRVAERFEVYFQGIELANGFHELTDSHEQLQRFKKDNHKRAASGLPKQPIDTYLIDALSHGIPDSSGVALGIDRLVMLALQADQLSDVITFTVDHC
ncbi:elongation factor P--(R)-beta-lysine ligase [Candidatus Erwinia haradaeae]|uniref:Elongation factor P--(R)-beta-lysine ligase n=1 Tax=Candidatus Erwinia haradaeae TaxID=1922217 RepID=A0A451DA94_9GAMM|nr:elongation factor P--(R)-beta-lysine ligase [Candidatus Erwinia haradaeae]VFP83199.1 Elongation factor P--(R)-beta-lysine ligase [Candidatus Erwinia haradaeae]